MTQMFLFQESSSTSVVNECFTSCAPEEWRCVTGFLGYEVSSKGRFRSSKRLIGGTFAHNGYLHVGFVRDGKQHFRLAHRVVAEAFLEKPSVCHCIVNHKDGKRDNNALENLEWATRSWNSKHASMLRKRRLLDKP